MSTPTLDGEWALLSQGSAPSWLGPVKMPDVHLSQQIAWFHKVVGDGLRRAGVAVARRMMRRHRRGLKRPGPAPGSLAKDKAAKRAAYMRRYRELRRLDRLRMRGERLSAVDKVRLEEHRRRCLLLRKARDRRRRKAMRDLYLAMIERDRRRASGLPVKDA